MSAALTVAALWGVLALWSNSDLDTLAALAIVAGGIYIMFM